MSLSLHGERLVCEWLSFFRIMVSGWIKVETSIDSTKVGSNYFKIKVDVFAKSLICSLFVIPAKAGIQ